MGDKYVVIVHAGWAPVIWGPVRTIDEGKRLAERLQRDNPDRAVNIEPLFDPWFARV